MEGRFDLSGCAEGARLPLFGVDCVVPAYRLVGGRGGRGSVLWRVRGGFHGGSEVQVGASL